MPFTRQVWKGIGYLLAGLPLAVEAMAIVIILICGIPVSVVFLGLPLIAITLIGTRYLAARQRGLAFVLVGERVEAPQEIRYVSGLIGWLRGTLSDTTSWRAVGYFALKLPLTVVGLFITTFLWTLALSGFLIVLVNAIRWEALVHWGMTFFWSISFYSPGGVIEIAVAGLVAFFVFPWVVRGFVAIDRRLVRNLLGPGPSERIRALEETRAIAVDDAAVRLRRIERDLHDGTQAQLSTLAMNLGQAKEKLTPGSPVPYDPEGALELIDAAHRHAKDALAELRDIVRGIHSPALDLGLDAALATLAARSTVPTTLRVDIPSRPTPAIETILYFSAAELLANVTKHSQARHATIEVVVRNELLCLKVSDDGIGGARVGAGSGLMGMADRLRAVDGHLQVSSPKGGPTVVAVEVPF